MSDAWTDPGTQGDVGSPTATPNLVSGGALEPPVMGEMSAARQAGHEWDAIDQYMGERWAASRAGGYNDAEIGQYLGYKDPSLRLGAIGQEANALTYANDVDGTAGPADKVAFASGNLFKPIALGKPMMQDGPLPPELRAEYAQGLMGGEFTDAAHFAQSYTESVFNAAGSDGAHPLAQQASQELSAKLPGTQDLIDWSLALGGPDPAVTRDALMKNWVSNGENPKEAYQRAQTDQDFRLDLTTPKPVTPPTVAAKVQAHFGEPTLDEQMAAIWGGDMLPGATSLVPAVRDFAAGVAGAPGQMLAGMGPDTLFGAGVSGFKVGVQGTYDWAVANGFVRPEDGSFAPLNMINKALVLPAALLAGSAEATGDMAEKYGEQIGQPLLGRTIKEMITNWGGMLGSPHMGVEEMDPAHLAKLDATVKLLVDTAADSSGAGKTAMRAAPLGRDVGDIMPPTSGAFNRFHDTLPAGTVLPFGDAGIRVHDDVRQFQGNVATDRTGFDTLERGWAKDHPEWFKPDFLQRATTEVEQRGVDGTSLSPEVDAFWSHPEWRGARQAAFKDWSEHEIRLAGEEGREPADRALEPFDDNFIPRQMFNEKAGAAGPDAPQWLEEAEPIAFHANMRPLRKQSGPALRTEGRQFYTREFEDGTRELADNSRSKDKVKFGDEGRFRGKNFTVRDASIQEITEAGDRPAFDKASLPPVAEGRTRLYKAERAEDAAPNEGWVRTLESAQHDLREGTTRTGKIHYIDVDPREKTSTPRPLYPDPEKGTLVQDPSFPRRYNLDERLFTGEEMSDVRTQQRPRTDPEARTNVSMQGQKPPPLAGREPKEVPQGEPRPTPLYRMDPIRNLRDSWLTTRTKSYAVQFLTKNRDELESMGLFKKPRDDLGNWQNEKPPTFTVQGKKQAGVVIDLPLGFKGWVPKDLKAEFDRYIGPAPTSQLGHAWDQANRFLVRALFISPLPHEFNVAAHYIVGRGLWGTLGPPGIYRAVRYTGEAMHQVFTNGSKYRDTQRAGAGLLFGRTIGQDIAKLHLQQMENLATRSPASKAFDVAAKSLGYASGYRAVRAIYRGAQKNLWFVNDTLMMSRVLELQHLRGGTLVEAIRDAEREIASYDAPTKFLKSKLLADALANNKVISFGRYDMNRINMWKNMVTDLVGHPRTVGTWSDLKVRAHALDQAAMAAALIVFGAPLANSVFQKITGNPLARLMLPGPLFVMDMARRLREGDLAGALPFHASALVNAAIGVGKNLNPYGKPTLNGHKGFPGMAADAARFGASLLPPVNTGLGVLTGSMTPADALVKTVINARLPKPGADLAQRAAQRKAQAQATSEEARDPIAQAIRRIMGGRQLELPGRTSNPLGPTTNPLGSVQSPFK